MSMTSNPDFIRTLEITQDQRESFRAVADRVSTAKEFDPYNQELCKLSEAEIFELAAQLPSEFCSEVAALRSGTGSSILVIRNAPGDFFVPPTPEIDLPSAAKGILSEFFIRFCGQLLGSVFYSDQRVKRGAIIHQVIPMDGKEKLQTNTGSATFFPFHTEGGYRPLPPDFLMLYCLRGHVDAATQFIGVDEILHDAPEWVREGVRRNEYVTTSGVSFASNDKPLTSRAPILKDIDGSCPVLCLNCNPNKISASSKEGSAVLEYLFSKIDRVKPKSITLAEHDMLIVDNRRVMHARTSFDAGPLKAERRWLQRAQLIREERMPR
jgi:L-asparagine oxygenase